MRLRDPFTIPTPSQVRPVGQAPFWTPGQTVTWTFRRFDFDRDRAEVARPMRVIADGPDGAVLWLAGGTPTQETRIVGWEETNAHDVPLKARFRPLAAAPTRINVEGTWRGRGVLKIVPPQVPFSVWVLLKDDADGGVRVEWYINLRPRTNAPMMRCSPAATFSTSLPISSMPLHAEDGRLDPAGAVFKDVDELAAAAGLGRGRVVGDHQDNGSHLLDHLGDFGGPSNPNGRR